MDQLPADPVHRASHWRGGVWLWLLVSGERAIKEGGTLTCRSQPDHLLHLELRRRWLRTLQRVRSVRISLFPSQSEG